MAVITPSTLINYVDQISQPLISRAILEAQTVKIGRLITGIKYAEQINILELNPFNMQINNLANAGFNDTGTTIVSAVTLVVCPLKSDNQFFLETLENIWMGQLLKAGSYLENAPIFEEQFAMQLGKAVSQFTDLALWTGGYIPGGANSHSADTAGNTGVIGSCQGILYNLYNTSASGNTTVVSYSGVPTQGTIYGIVNAMVAAIPDNMLMLPNLSIWCKPSYVNMYKQALINLGNGTGNFHFFVQGADQTSDLNIRIPGNENVVLRGTPALAGWAGNASASGNGYQGFVLTNDENLLIGVDLENDSESLDIWYSLDFQMLRTRVKLKIGGQIALATQAIVY